MPGRDQGLAAVGDLVPLGQLMARGPGAHPVELIGEVRSGAVETDEEMEELFALVARDGGTRTLPEPAGKAVVPGRSRRFPVVPGGFGHGWPPGSPILTS